MYKGFESLEDFEKELEDLKMVSKIRKRDGDVVTFDEQKIENAIWKAVCAVSGKDRESNFDNKSYNR